MILDVAGSSNDNGALIHQWDWNGGGNPPWRIEQVPRRRRPRAGGVGLCVDFVGHYETFVLP